MSEWQRGVAAAALPPWIQPAGIGPRAGAWLIDALFMGLLGLIPAGVAVALGGLAWNPEALRQTDNDLFATPSVPWLEVRTLPLVVSGALWVLITVAYGAIGWRAARGQPGQRMRSIEVADARTGRNLSAARALLRAVLVNGVPAAATAALAVSGAELMAIVPANATSNSNLLRSGDAAVWATVSSMGVLTAVIWAGVVLVSTSSSSQKRGLHDRISGSVVVRRPARFGPWGLYPYGMPPGWYGPPPGSGAAPSAPAPTTPPGPGFLWPPAGGGWPAQPQAPTPLPWTGLAQPGVPSNSDAGPAAGPAPEAGGQPSSASPSAVEPPESAAEPEPAASANPSGRGATRKGVFGSKLPEGLRVATYRRRAAAYGLDTIMVLAAYSAIQAAVAPTGPSGELVPERSWMLAGLLGGLVQAAYFVGGWWLLRGTPGQKALGLQVGRESSGKRLGLVDALVRWAALQGPVALWLAAPYVTQVLLFVVVVGWVIVLSRSVRDDPDGRGYHDRLAGSMVVEEI